VEPLSHGHRDTSDCLLVNPAAGGGRAKEVFPKLRAFAKEHSWNLEFVMTGSAGDLTAKAREAAIHGCQRIFVLGGDGTFQLLLNAVADFPEIILGVIPAGGGNDLASALGLPADPLQAASLLLAGQTCQLDTVCVRTSEGVQRLYCGGGGVGLDAEAARYASGAYRNLRGRLRYLLSAIRALFDFHSMQARVAMHGSDSQTLQLRALVVAVLNTPSYGAGLCLAPDANINDGALDVVVLEDLRVTQILALLPSLWSSGYLQTDRVRRFRVHQVRIETETPRCFHADGEILGTTPVEITVLPRKVRVLCAPAHNR
jgi:diacylglycerol kinase (ATP)